MALSLIIFFSAMISAVFAWNYISTDAVQTQEMKEMQLSVLTLSDSILRTPGVPADWNESTVKVIGLVNDENILADSKVRSFTNMSYSTARSLLGVYPYDFYFEIKDVNGTVYGNTTFPVSSDASIVVPAERYAMYNGRIVKVKFVMWA